MTSQKTWSLVGLAAVVVVVVVIATIYVLPGGNGGTTEFEEAITVVGRDSASGTRATFQELIDIEDEEIVPTMLQMSSNGGVKETVVSTKGAIGYVGLGYIDDTVKAVQIGPAGSEITPSVQAVQDGSYPISRSLYMITNGQPAGLAKDFVDFVLSSEGQAIVEDESFVPMTPGSAEAGGFTGTLVIKGSTTVLPIAQAAAQAYMDKYPGTTIEVSGGGSSQGVSSVGEGSAEIGMASRNIKDSEMTTYPNLVPHTVAKDGIGVIAHPDNPITSLTVEEVKAIYAGTYISWDELL